MRSNKLDLDFYSPTINLGRDPRWGRNDESYGEDPLLEAKVASQFVNGMEGKDQNGQLLPDGDGFYKATTTLKHYAMNNTEGFANTDPNGRLNGSSNADDRTIREYYTMPFRKIVQASQTGAVMSSYNEINGVPVGGEHLPDRHADARDVRLPGLLHGRLRRRSTRSTPRHHWQPDGFGHTADRRRAVRVRARRSGEDAECNAGYNGSGNYRGPTAPSTTAGGTMNAIGMHITTRTGHAHGQRPRRVGDPPVHEPDEARRVQPGLDGAVADPGAVSRSRATASIRGSAPLPTMPRPRRRADWRLRARPATRRSCC